MAKKLFKVTSFFSGERSIVVECDEREIPFLGTYGEVQNINGLNRLVVRQDLDFYDILTEINLMVELEEGETIEDYRAKNSKSTRRAEYVIVDDGTGDIGSLVRKMVDIVVEGKDGKDHVPPLEIKGFVRF